MIKNEWKSLWENKFMLIVVIAIIAIPLIYAGLFLKSMWDPYGEIENLPVAVVNNDVPVEYEGKTLQVGDDLVDELKDNNSLAFNFVDADVAEQGLKNGTFYMVITIPEDFSGNATTLMDESPKKMELTYETNPGTNYIASKMSETALLKIKDSVAAEVTKTYSENVFDQIATIGDGMQDAADGSLQLKEGIEEAAKGSDTISTNLNTLANGASDLTAGTSKLEKGVKDYTDGAGKINAGAKKLSEGTKDLKKGTDTLKTKSTQYTDGVDTLADGVTAYVDGANQLAAGAKKLVALEKLGDVSDGISQLNAAVTTGSKTSPSLISGAASLKEGIGTIQSSVGGASETLGSLSSGMTDAANTIQAASVGISNAAQLSKQGAKLLSDSASEISKTNTSIENANSAIDSVIADLEQAKKDGADVDGALSTLKNLGNISTISLDTQSMQSISNGLSGVSDGLKPAIDGLANGAKKMAAANPGNTMAALSAGLQEAYSGAARLEEGVKQVSAGLQKLETSTASFPAAAAGITALNQGFDTLTENNTKLKEGAKALKNNTPAVTKGISDLASGAKQLNKGTSDLLSGTKELTSNNITLLSGTSQLKEGTAKISEGSLKLYDGSLELQAGMDKLQDGSKELHDAIQDAANEVKEVDTNVNTYEMFATPIEDEETKITHVENNGHAMAPYMMSVGLWVGCLAFCLVYPLMSYKGELKSGLAWWASKATVLYPVAVLQGIFLITMLNKLAGFQPVEYGKTIAFACLTAVTFTSIMYFFNIWLGKIGSFLMLVFMVVQLAGSAGTYPVELSPDFVSKIHNLVPFTYTVNAFRSTICGGESIAVSVRVMVVLFMIFTTATIVSFHFKGVAKRKGKILPYDWLEERGLA
ncbi:MAG: YhgE/Pip domain-containing protein [Lachnospiraceae bacterium]|nr:YhgE/Pip domain-containing protein [Lachnospiraceae bacterium]